MKNIACEAQQGDDPASGQTLAKNRTAFPFVLKRKKSGIFIAPRDSEPFQVPVN